MAAKQGGGPREAADVAIQAAKCIGGILWAAERCGERPPSNPRPENIEWLAGEVAALRGLVLRLKSALGREATLQALRGACDAPVRLAGHSTHCHVEAVLWTGRLSSPGNGLPRS